MSVVSNPQNNDNVVITPPNNNKVVVNKQTSDKVVVTKTTQEVLRVATGIKGDPGPQGPTGPQGITGDPGVYEGPTPPEDTSLVWVDTSGTGVSGGGQQIFGLADPQGYTALPKSIVIRTNTTNGWTGLLMSTGSTVSVDSSFGVGKEAVTTTLRAGPSPSTPSLYYDFTTPLVMTGRRSLSFEFMQRWYTGNVAGTFELVVATGPALTGDLITQPTPSTTNGVWTIGFIDVPLGTSIGSIGVRVTSFSVGATDRVGFWIRDVSLEPVSQAQAAQVAGKVPVITEALSEASAGYLDPATTTPRLDLRRNSAVLPGLHGWWDSREWRIPEDGVTDATPYIAKMLEDVPPRAKIKFPSNGVYRISGQLNILRPVTLDFNGSILYDPVRRVPGESAANFIEVSGYVTDVTLSNGSIYATKSDTITAGNNLTTVSGTVTSSGTTALLSGVGDSGEYRPRDAYARWLGQHYEPGYGVNNRCDVTLSGDGTSSALIEIITDLGKSIASKTVTPPSTETLYSLRGYPEDLGRRLFIRVTKVSGSQPIVIHNIIPWGMNTYDADFEFTNGIVVKNASRVLIENWWIENVGGEATIVQCFDRNLGYITFKNVVGRCSHTQNHAPTTCRYVTFDSCASYESARTGFDCEPYGSGWAVDNLILRNCESRNDRNYSISVNNWGLISNLTIDNFRSTGWGIGAFIGGSRGGRITGFSSFRTAGVSPTDEVQRVTADMVITGMNMVISDLSLSNGLEIKAGTWTLDGNYTAGGNRVTNFTCNNLLSVGYDQFANIRVLDGTSVISGGAVPSTTATNSGSGVGYSTAANITPGTPIFGLDVGRYRQALPNTFKGLAVDKLWWPYGIESSDSLVNTSGISGTSIRSKNFRGIGIPVTTGSASASVMFTIKSGSANLTNPQALTVSPTIYTGSTATSLVSSTPYYYAVCGIVDYDDYGHRPLKTTATGSGFSSPNNSYSLRLRGVLDWDHGTVLAGFAIYRGSSGTASGGPWNARYIIKPTGPWFSIRNDMTDVIDTGTTLEWSNWPLDNRLFYGYSTTAFITSVETGLWDTTNGPTLDTTGYEADSNYSILVTPSWVTTVAVTAKRNSGFNVSFGTPAPAGATFDWVLIR